MNELGTPAVYAYAALVLSPAEADTDREFG